MSFQVCFQRLKDYVKESGLSKNIPSARLEYFARKLEAVSAESMTPAEFAAKSQDMIEGDFAREQAARKAANAQTLYLREQALDNIQKSIDLRKEQIAKGFKGTPSEMAYETLRDWQTGGGIRTGIGTNVSVDLMASRNKASLMLLFKQGLDAAHITDIAQSPKLDHDTFLELDALDRNTQKGLTGNPDALEYAKVLKSVRDSVFTKEQSRNPFLAKAQEYLWQQMHDPDRIAEMGKDAWTELAMKTFGDKSYLELSPPEKVKKFQESYDKIVAGKWGSTLPEYEPGQSGNILRRQAASRSWTASDAKAFADYAAQAGPATIYDGMAKIISRSSRDIALLQKAGPTPDLARNGLYQKLLDTLPPEESAFLKSKENSLNKDWQVVKGVQNTPAQGTFAKFVQGAQTWQFLTKAGGAIMRAIPGDISLGGSLLRDLNGSGMAKNAFDIASEYAKAFASTSYRNERLDDLGLFAQTARNEILRNFGAPDPDMGKMSKLAQAAGTLSGYNRHIEAMQSAIGTVLTRNLGRQADNAWADLAPAWKTGLQRYGITEPEWSILRRSTEQVDGRTHLTPEAVQLLPREYFENYLLKSGQVKGAVVPNELIAKTRDDLETKLGLMINEHARLGTAHTDTRQRAFMWGDTNADEGMGQLRRMLWQFKSATLVSADVYRRGYYAAETPKSGYVGIANHMIMSAFLTGIAGAVGSLLTGKTPENPFDSVAGTAKLLTDSGAGGIYGSLLTDELQHAQGWQDRTYAGMNAALGPAIGTAFQATGIAAQAAAEAAGEVKRPQGAAPAAKLLNSSIPGANLVYTKAIFDYYFANQLREFTGPGYLHALERGAGQRGQSYLFGKPTGNSFFEGE